MWRTRLIAQKSRVAARAPVTSARLDTRWICGFEYQEEKESSPILYHQQYRHFSIRRHGWKGDDDDSKKKNFAKEYIEPAARGELKEKHSSGIPKLSVRKTKGHNIHGEEDYSDDMEMDMEMEDDEDFDFDEAGGLDETMRMGLSRAKASKSPASQSSDSGKPVLSALDLGNGKDPEYWKEEDFEERTKEERAYFRATYGVQNSLTGLSREKLDEIHASEFKWKASPKAKKVEEEGEASEGEGPKGDGEEDTKEKKTVARPRNEVAARERVSKEEELYPFFDSKTDKVVTYKTDTETAIPMQWVESRYYAYHHESKREPLPFYPKNRKNPHPVILEFFSRWLYVSNLPPALPEAGMEFGKATKLTALEEQEIVKTVTGLFGVATDQVYPASESSAFIGFESQSSRAEILRKGPSTKVLSKPVTISPYSPSGEEDEYAKAFLKGADAKAIVKLEDVPPNTYSRETLARDLFPEGSELGTTYPLSRDKVWFLSPTTALICFESPEQAKSALASTKVSARLEELGQYPIKLLQAKRNVLHDRMQDKYTEIRKLGHRLVVDGDMPSKEFYISHAGVIMLRNLDLHSVTKESISAFFQPFSPILRDVRGSIEFVKSSNGLPTDVAYVGFERLGEAEAVIDALKGSAQIGDNKVILKLMKDRKIPGTPPRRVRPERSEDEIIKNLNNWQEYVDPEDLKYLQEHGVAFEVIDESLRGLRHHNRSFKALDWAMQEEKLEPSKASGDDYREVVQLYIETLKECVATPENPGPLYENMHFPGEKIDLSIFESDKKRMQKLLKKREA